MDEQTLIFDKVFEFLEKRNFSKLKELLQEMNPADIALLFEDLEGKDIPLLFRLLPKQLAADTFSYLESDKQVQLIGSFSDVELREITDNMFIDDTVDIIEEMPANVVTRILRNTDSETRKTINELLKYPKDSAGSIMTTEFLYLDDDMTVSEAFQKIRQVGVTKETINTCFVTKSRKLLGQLSPLELLTSDEDTLVTEIMDTSVIKVNTHEDQENVARMFDKYDIAAMPVVDNEDRLVGIVTFDDAIEVLQEENTEDFEKMAAMMPIEDSYFKTSVFKHAKKRVLWLLVLMISATFTGMLLTKYENAFAALPILISFIPMLMDTGGNCGSQTSTMIIRGFALGEISTKDFFKVMFKEFRISLIVSFILAVVNGIRIYLMYFNSESLAATGTSPLLLAVVVSLSIICAVIIAKFVGCVLPMFAKMCKLDPAIMASPMITTVADAAIIFVYFNIAMKFFNI